MFLGPGTQRTLKLSSRTSLGCHLKPCPGRTKVKDILVNKTNIESLL